MVPLERLALVLNFNFITDNILLNIGLLILMIFLFAASAFFSSTETAFSSVNIIRLRNYLDEKRKGAKKAVYIAEKFDLALTTILVGNNFVNILATTISAFIFGKLIINPTLSNALSTLIMTFIILIFGEIIPKTYSKEHSDKVALRNAGLLYALIKILYPLTWFFLKLRTSFFKKSQSKSTNPYVTEEELESIIDVMEIEGVIDEDDAELIQSAINLNDRTVYDIMTPRVDAIAIEINSKIEEIKNIFFEYQFSRIPIYESDKDNMIGVLSERDFFTALLKSKEPDAIDITSLMTKPYFVSKSTKVNDLIKNMQLLKKHFAIVYDEYGGTSGIVTMEDALEELVGEIYDEYDDIEEQNILKTSDTRYILSSEMELEELFEQLKLGDNPTSKYTTVGGFVYELYEGFPEEGKSIHYTSVYEEHDMDNPVIIHYDLEFIIKKVENRRIRIVELHIHDVTDNR